MNKLFAITPLLVSMQTLAVQPLSSELTQVAITWDGDGLVMRFKDSLSYDEGSEICSDRAIMLSSESNPLFEESLSILLSALHAESVVTIAVDGCEGTDMRVMQ